MKNCREITRLLSEAQERELTLGERASLRIHTAICSGCRNFGRQMNVLRGISRAYSQGAADKVREREEGKGKD